MPPEDVETWRSIGALVFRMLDLDESLKDEPLAGTGTGRDATRGRLVVASVDGFLLERVLDPLFDAWGFNWRTDKRFVRMVPEMFLAPMPKRDRPSARRLVTLTRDMSDGWRNFSFQNRPAEESFVLLVRIGSICARNLEHMGAWNREQLHLDWSNAVTLPLSPGSPHV